MLGPFFLDMLNGIKEYFNNFIRSVYPSEQTTTEPPTEQKLDSDDGNPRFNLNPRTFCDCNVESSERSFTNRPLAKSSVLRHTKPTTDCSEMKVKSRPNRWSFKDVPVGNSFEMGQELLNSQDSPTCPSSSLTRAHSVELDARSGGSGIPAISDGEDIGNSHGHQFCPIPMEVDTFCDFCSQPIYGLGWGPVCQRCAGCHMTCHWLCKDKVRVRCQSPISTDTSGVGNDDNNNNNIDSTPIEKSSKTTTEESELGEIAIEFAKVGLDRTQDDRELQTNNSEQNVDLQYSVPAAQPGSITNTISLDSTLPTFGVPSDQVPPTSFPLERTEKENHIPSKSVECLEPPTEVGSMLPNGDARRSSEYSLFVGDVSYTNNEFSTPSRTVYYTARSDFPRSVQKARVAPSDFVRTSNGLEPAGNSSSFQNSPHAFKPPTGPASGLSRRATNWERPRRPQRTHLTSRHSFLAGHGSDATIYSRLSYDFSSLDKDLIRANGIRVREVSPTHVDPEAIPNGVGSPVPPRPPQRVSSLIKSAGSSPTHPSLSTSPPPPAPSPADSSEIGLASVMQTTGAYVKNKSKRNKHPILFPAPPIPLHHVMVGPRGRLPYTLEQLAERLSVFNKNEYGLQANTISSLPAGDCTGQIRIHINLLRPIRMLLNVRPASIFDVVGKDDETEEDTDTEEFSWNLPSPTSPEPSVQGNKTVHSVGPVQFDPPRSAVTANAPAFPSDYQAPFLRPPVMRRYSKRLVGSRPKSTTFWVPRGSTKLLHVRLSTTAHNVIVALLDRFNIEDDPQKFALYEHTIEGEQEVSVRKLFDDESPLGLFLRWTEEGPAHFNQVLGLKRLVLQENETGDIDWTGFSLPELTTFLAILNQEEADYRRRIELKFELRKKEILRLMALHETSAAQRSKTLPPSLTTFTVTGKTGSLDEDAPGAVDDETKGLEGATPDHRPSSVTESVMAPASPLCSDDQETVQKDAEPTYLPDPNFTVRLDSSKLFEKSDDHPLTTALSTLPRALATEGDPDKKMKPSFFKRPSALHLKRSERAQQKRLAKLEEERIKAEKKRLKAEAKQSQNPHPSRARRWLGLPGLSVPISPPAAPSEARSTLKP
ncbi:unnamed protein product [Calicophoron daubneyi]|uniref:Rassf1 n=1 Tax=Calicophoron daubneyi TaxID=300641 RepID=A0AAV2TLA8_CALDB